MKKVSNVLLIINICFIVSEILIFILAALIANASMIEMFVQDTTGNLEGNLEELTTIFRTLFIICAVFEVIPLLISFLSISKLNKAKEKKQLIALAILNILFCSGLGIITGILMLCIKDSDLNGSKEEVKTVETSVQENQTEAIEIKEETNTETKETTIQEETKTQNQEETKNE